MTAKTCLASVIAVVAIAACGTTKPSSTTGSATSNQAVVWAGCLRAHGLSNFPDPIPGHKAMFPDSAGTIMSSRSPAVLSAERACKKLNPVAGRARGGANSNLKAAILEYARCMRAHGVPDYPDPTYDRNGQLRPPDLSGQGIDTQSPAFTSAARVCDGHGVSLG